MSEEEKVDVTTRLKGLILDSVTAHINETPQINLDSEAARDNLAYHIAVSLSPYVEGYEDEIRSLWFMLDELKQSERALGTVELHDEISNMVNLQLAKLKIMQNQKGDA
jgi:hypothetical protein